MITYGRIYPPDPPPELISVWDGFGNEYYRGTDPDSGQDLWQPADDPEDDSCTWRELLDEVGQVTDTSPRDGQSGWRPGHEPHTDENPAQDA